MADPNLTAAYSDLLRPIEAMGQGRSTRPKYVGGKATSLGRLAREGFPVPRGWVLDGREFMRAVEKALPRGHDVASLIKMAGTQVGTERAARARDRLLAEPLSDAIVTAVEALWRDIEPHAPWGLAVRSSATCEDTEDTSLAGLAATVLGVRGPSAILAAIREVWASAVMPRALSYLAHAGVRDIAMAVVIQVMVRAESAGVLFTSPPPGLEGPAWRKGERLVHATFGLGAPVVEGSMRTDSIRMAPQGGAVIGTVIAHKTRALVVGAHGVEAIPVPEAHQNDPALTPEVLRALAHYADQLDAWGKGGLDVEFAVERTSSQGSGESARRVWLLQARPLSGRGFPEGGDETTVWSRANVGEALPGAATPLTWSIARGFSDKGFRDAFEALGCNVPRGAKLVANVQSRFYLNLSAFMRIAAQVPGLTPRRILGVSGGASEAAIAVLEAQVEDVATRRFFLRLPLMAPRVIAAQARLAGEVTSFEADAIAAQRALREMDLVLLPDDSIAMTLKGARSLLDRTGGLMLRAASASLASHVALCAVLSRLTGRRASARAEDTLHDSAGSGIAELAQTLTGGVRELDSASPGIALARVAEIARGEPTVRERLERGEVHTAADLPPGPTRRAFESFLEVHGDRAVREAELRSPRWREDPANAIAMLTASLRSGSSDPDKALARARATADRELARLETRLSSIELALVRTLVERTQHFTRLRERMRTWVTRVLGMLRTIALDVDRRLRRIDPSLAAGSVFFCHYDELTAALSSGRAEIGAVVRLRYAEFARDDGRPDPPPTFIGRPNSVTLPPASGARLVGLAASSGVVEGRARVLEPGAVGLDAVEAGEVLVSRTTDVGLSPLFLVAAAIVTELGGPLSHAAVVAREYGVPAVVNVPGATTAIRTGDRIRVDGDRGIVELLDIVEPRPPSLRPPPLDLARGPGN